MVTTLKQITGSGADENAYKFGEIIGVTDSRIQVRLTSGLEVSINSTDESYSIGDQVVLGISDSNLNNLFVLKKLDRAYPNAINYSVGLDND